MNKYDLIIPMSGAIVAGVGGWLGGLPGLVVGLFLAFVIYVRSDPAEESK